MSGIRYSNRLPVGIEVDGVVHRDFTMRPRLVRDSVAISMDPETEINAAYRGVALIAEQIEALGTLPKERITAALLLDMFDEDMGELLKGHDQLQQLLMTFRGAAEAATPVAADAGEDRGAVASGA